MRIFVVLGIIFSLFSESIAMMPIDEHNSKVTTVSKVQIRNSSPMLKQPSVEVPLFMVQVLSNPPVKILKLSTPYRRLILDEIIVSPVLSLACGSFYKGIEIRSPLFLMADMDNASFFDIIARAFRPNKCIHSNYVVPKKFLETKFHCLIQKK